MSLASTLAVADFADLIRVSDIKLTPMWMQERALTGGGETLYADRAPMLWRAEITTPPMENGEAEGLLALVNSRSGALETVLLYNSRFPAPSSDPDGSTWAVAAPTAVVGTITNRLNAAFAGLPANYVIPRGSYVGILFDTSRYYLGQFAEARTADGSGDVATVRLAPALPDSVQAGDAVTLVKPPFKARIVPGTAYLSSLDTLNARLSLTAEQTYSA